MLTLSLLSILKLWRVVHWYLRIVREVYWKLLMKIQVL